jgi:hypothetical protein
VAACLRVDSTPTPGQGDVSLQNNKSTALSAQRAVSAEAQAIAKRLPFVVVAAGGRKSKDPSGGSYVAFALPRNLAEKWKGYFAFVRASGLALDQPKDRQVAQDVPPI